MTAGDREGLVARIRQVRRVAAVRDQSTSETESLPSTSETEPLQPERVRSLETTERGRSLETTERVRSLERRVAHLERLVEGLQDSVHRESGRHSKLIAEIQAQIEPGAMRTALADDARTRGL